MLLRHNFSRRTFLKTTGLAVGGFASGLRWPAFGKVPDEQVRVSAHLWAYASKFPPHWDSTPVLEQVFSDLSYAGLEGLELMEVNLRHADAVQRIGALADQYQLPVTGTSYSGSLWDKSTHTAMLEDLDLVTDRLQQLGGTTLGISVGDAKHPKTSRELDDQATALQRIREMCTPKKIVPNLHNHTYEVANDLHDLKGTLERLPDYPLGPDLNWLVRGAVDPVNFIRRYGDQIVYLHLRDQHADGQWTEAVGEGSMNFPAISRALHDVNFSGIAAIELAFDQPPERALKENWKISRAYVQQTFGW